MNNDKLQRRLNRKDTDIFIRWNDAPTMQKLLILLYSYDYNFVNMKNYDTNQSCEKLKSQMENDFYNYYHGNSKPILHIFYNDINEKNEIQFITKSVIKSYPQYRKAKVYSYYG